MANRGADIVDAVDSTDQDLYNYCSTRFEPETASGLREEIAVQFEYPTGSRLLILHLAKVLPEYRGKQRAERLHVDQASAWIKSRPRSYQEQGDWILERLKKDPWAHADRAKKCADWSAVLKQLAYQRQISAPRTSPGSIQEKQ